MDHRSLVEEFSATDRRRRADVDRHLRVQRPRGRRRAGAIGRTLARTAMLVTGTIIVMALLACLPLAWYQKSLIYWASAAPIGKGQMPSGTTLVRYASDSNADYAAYMHQGDPDMPVVVYLHGRGEGLRLAQMNTSSYVMRDWTVVIPEYPGFSGLRGEPSEKSISRLMQLVVDDLAARRVPPERLVIHGNSLGAGPAMVLAQHPHAALLLTAPVARLAEVMHHWLPFVPSFLLSDRWDNVERAGTRHPSPAIVVQSLDDQVVPIDQGRAMARATGARMVELPEGGHSVGWNAQNLHYSIRGFDYDGTPLRARRPRS